MFYIASLFVGFGASGISLVPCGALINNWFEEKKGLATGIAFTGSVAGGLIFVQLTKILLAASGWQTVYTALGIIAAVVAIPITVFVVREHPRDKGLLPFGAKEAAGAAAGFLKGISLKKYIKTGSFWLLAISVFIIGFINMGLQNNISIYLTSARGHTENVAANIFSLYLFIQIFGKVLLGAIYDKKGIKFGAIYCMAAFLLSVALFIYSGNLYIAIAFAAVFALVGSMTTVTPPYVTATIVGLKDYPTIFGILSLFYGIGVATGPVVAARVFDSTGSFDQVWIAFGIMAVIIVFTTVLAAKKGEGFSQIAD
jgi:MFS family permease